MADKKTDTKATDKTPPEPAPDADAAPKPIDETVPGGHYIVDGMHVDAEGNELTKAGKPKARAEE